MFRDDDQTREIGRLGGVAKIYGHRPFEKTWFTDGIQFREADFYTNLIASKAIMYQYDKNKDGILTAREFHKPWRHFCTIFNRTYKDILRLWKKYESNYSISGEPLKDLDYKEFRNGLDEKSLTLLISELVLVSVNDILRNAQQHGYASFVDELE